MTDEKTDPAIQRISFRTGMKIPAGTIEKRFRHRSGHEMLLLLKNDPDYLYLVDESDLLTYRVLNNPARVSPLPYPPEELLEVSVSDPEGGSAIGTDTVVTSIAEVSQRQTPQVLLLPLLRRSPPGTRLSPEDLHALLAQGSRGRLFRLEEHWLAVDDQGFVVFNELTEPQNTPAVADAPPKETREELDEGEHLPFLDDRWQPDGPRFRARIGNFLYYCQSRPDQGYEVTDKLFLPVLDAGGADGPPPPPPPSPTGRGRGVA